MLRFIKKLFFFSLFLGLAAATALGGYLYWVIALHPGEEIKIENIRAILGKESPVFYNNGHTKLGVFFDQAHRQYVSYDRIPVNFVNALVASEDNKFFSHYGVDVFGIARAMLKNYQAGRIVQGGSTLTQQTAKNLFKRSGRSYEAKLKELIFALRLEYHYSKEQIFEFYANQFYVSGNGHGLGIAARYYFDKKVEDLTLLECAYIAGSVKRPNYYNPFRKKTEEGLQKAKERTAVRVRYVLKKMLAQGMITPDAYRDYVKREVVFKKGEMGYSLDYVMEMVRNAMSAQEVTDALAEHGIENVSTSGIRIITTIDEVLQKKALFSLRRELSRLDVRLRGYDREIVQKELAALDYSGDQILRKGAFVFGTVKDKTGQGDEIVVHIDLGRKLGQGSIDKSGVARIVQAMAKYERQRWSEDTDADYITLFDQLQVGDRVWVSVRDSSKAGATLLDLEKYPEIEGAGLVVQNGSIKAMAGGVENRFFNRAIDARRTMGSAFKPLVFAAALQLGWNSVDSLDNSRNVFVYQNQAYFPRPDHVTRSMEVSMSWAGVRSENLASVWLLYHLCDHLTPARFAEVAKHLDLVPRVVNGETESYRGYRARIRDRHGVVVNNNVLKKTAFALAVRNLETDFIFDALEEEYTSLLTIQYGLGYSAFFRKIDEELEQPDLKKYRIKELKLRRQLLNNNFLFLLQLKSELQEFKNDFENPWARFTLSVSENPVEEESGQLMYDLSREKYVFVRDKKIQEKFLPVTREALLKEMDFLDEEEKKMFWQDVMLQNIISSDTVNRVEKQMQLELKKLEGMQPYSLDVLASIHDFRVLVGLQYLVEFTKKFGVKSALEPVLSFPLGSNVITLLEAARIYDGLVTGNVFLARGEDENRELFAILDRIESAEGEILYRPIRLRRQVLAQETVVSIGHILENIVKFGTGKYARKNVRVNSFDKNGEKKFVGLDIPVPLLGKTGTANRYTNAAFLGYLPAVDKKSGSMIVDSGYAVGTYVGYDDNRTMRRKTTRITGSAGALPLWTDMVIALVQEKEYGRKLDPVDLSFYGLSLKRPAVGQVNLAVDADNGGLLKVPAQEVDEIRYSLPSILTFGLFTPGNIFTPTRRFMPFWGSNEYLQEEDL